MLSVHMCSTAHRSHFCSMLWRFFSLIFIFSLRGIKQGAVLSPILFNLIINQILVGMDKDYTSLTVVGVDTGCCAHADDIRTCTVGAAKANRQAASLQSLTSEGSLSLNTDKTEILHLVHHLLPAEIKHHRC